MFVYCGINTHICLSSWNSLIMLNNIKEMEVKVTGLSTILIQMIF